MAPHSKISDRWNHDEFVAKKTPPSLIHDLMQPLNAYGLAAEQLRIRLSHTPTQQASLLGDLDAMNRMIHEVESMLSLLGTLWRLDSLPLQPVLTPTFLEDVFKAVLNCQGKDHPTLQTSIVGLDNQWVLSSANWLSTLLTHLLDFEAKHSVSLIEFLIKSSKESTTIKISSTKQKITESTESGAINIYIAEEIAKKIFIKLNFIKNPRGDYFSLSIPVCTKKDSKPPPNPDKPLTGKTISILDYNQNFSGELKKLLESWGCTVHIISKIEPKNKNHYFSDAIFLSLEAWNQAISKSKHGDPCLKFADKIFITIEKNTTHQKFNNVYTSDSHHILLPKPISPTRLQKVMISSLTPQDKK